MNATFEAGNDSNSFLSPYDRKSGINLLVVSRFGVIYKGLKHLIDSFAKMTAASRELSEHRFLSYASIMTYP